MPLRAQWSRCVFFLRHSTVGVLRPPSLPQMYVQAANLTLSGVSFFSNFLFNVSGASNPYSAGGLLRKRRGGTTQLERERRKNRAVGRCMRVILCAFPFCRRDSAGTLAPHQIAVCFPPVIIAWREGANDTERGTCTIHGFSRCGKGRETTTLDLQPSRYHVDPRIRPPR